MPQPSEDPLSSVVAAAARVLSAKAARSICLGDAIRLSDDERRNLLVRCREMYDGTGFIIKKVVANEYNPDDATSWDTTRFFSDWAGAEFLSDVLDARRSPRFLGGDRALGVFVLQDLGEHRSLVGPLLEEDAAGAEEALLAFSAALGAIHAGTIGQIATFEKTLHTLHPQARAFAPALEGLGNRAAEVRARLHALGVHLDAHLDRDFASVVSAIEKPGPFLSYIMAIHAPTMSHGREEKSA